MKLSVLLASALLPLGLMASPAAEADFDAEPGISLNLRGIVRPQTCRIIGGASYVNCRRGFHTKYSVRRKLRRGTNHRFWCVVSGQCITVNGRRNCGWHYSRDYNCYINGHYTDNHCTLARLGKCDDGSDRNSARPFRTRDELESDELEGGELEDGELEGEPQLS